MQITQEHNEPTYILGIMEWKDQRNYAATGPVMASMALLVYTQCIGPNDLHLIFWVY